MIGRWVGNGFLLPGSVLSHNTVAEGNKNERPGVKEQSECVSAVSGARWVMQVSSLRAQKVGSTVTKGLWGRKDAAGSRGWLVFG